MKFNWTEERKSTLKRMWAEGYSAGYIGTQLGISRNSAMGKVRRLKLPYRAKNEGHTRAVQAAKQKKKRPQPTKPNPFNPPFSPNASTERKPPSRPDLIFGRPNVIQKWNPPPLSPEDKEHILGGGVTFDDLQPHHCRWIITDLPRWGEHLYCGERAIEGLPYCGHHSRLAYQPAGERRRKEEAA